MAAPGCGVRAPVRFLGGQCSPSHCALSPQAPTVCCRGSQVEQTQSHPCAGESVPGSKGAQTRAVDHPPGEEEGRLSSGRKEGASGRYACPSCFFHLGSGAGCPLPEGPLPPPSALKELPPCAGGGAWGWRHP